MSTKWWTEKLARKRLAVLLAVSLVAASGCSLLPKEQEEEVLPEITPPQISQKPEYEVTTTTLETRVSASGKLISLQEETLFFTLDGRRLMELNVKVGDTVKAGQVIGRLDVEDLEKDLRQKRLQFRRDETAMKETLRKRDEMDPVDFEQEVINFEEKRQAIADQEAEIAKAELTAPISGTVVTVNVKKGDLIKAYDPVAVISDTSQLVAAVTLTKDDLEKVSVGMPVTVDLNNAGKVNGKIKQLPVPDTENGGNGNGGNGGTGGQNDAERPEDFLLVTLDKMPKGVQRGTPLSISIVVNRKENAIVIPPSALRSMGSRTYVQVVDENGKREVDVEVGQQTATEVEIIKGLTPGQKVVGR